MKLNKSSNQIEGKNDDFCNFSDGQAGNVTKPTWNFELKSEIYVKEWSSTDIMKKWDKSKYIYPHLCISLNKSYFNCSDLVYDRSIMIVIVTCLILKFISSIW